jgi:hypothetical protein
VAERQKELRRFRNYAKKQRMDLQRDRYGNEFVWGDTQTAWEAWWARAEMDKTPAAVSQEKP